ncbi:MAG: hypothetical protein H6581_22125 [Bacteroidia bacterium]|nr:hypothetical protein [Bacteroidia bacterium]
MEYLKNNSPFRALLTVAGAILILWVTGCKSDPFPRPKGYPRIDLPAHTYQTFDNENCPFTFEYPSFGTINRNLKDSCLTDIYFKPYDFYWHLTYRNIPGSGKSREKHEEEYRKLVYKHSIKLSHMSEFDLESENGTGLMYELHGTVGAPAQVIFGDRDSTHLIMVSFYFQQAVNQDSLRPLIDYVKEDLEHMAGSVVWR